MAINKEKLVKGRKYQEDFYLDDEDFVVLRSLSIGEVEQQSSKTKNQIELGFKLVSLSLVDPQLTVEEVREIEQRDFIKISERVMKISGVNEDTQTEVETFRQDQ